MPERKYPATASPRIVTNSDTNAFFIEFPSTGITVPIDTDGTIRPTKVAADSIQAGGQLMQTAVPLGKTVNIPTGYSSTVVGPYEIDGTITIDGRLRVFR